MMMCCVFDGQGCNGKTEREDVCVYQFSHSFGFGAGVTDRQLLVL